MEVFFYGLFMDTAILWERGIEPLHPRKAYLKDYTLKIGERASLIHSKGDSCYGMLMVCDKYSLQKLYSEPSVAEYVPEEVNVYTDQGESISALCYNLPPELIKGTNTTYAASLLQLAKQLEFPAIYLENIKAMAAG
ncbi:MAG: gamma-glutamylcyclotransferase [Cytophagales bacterium]|nr:gamma-glutamylcyclotransferase [Cytophagales bacterium]